MNRPTIGITAAVETMTTGAWVERTAGTPMAYVEAVQRAGGRALLLVPDAADTVDPGDLLGRVDGLLVTGAAGDMDPRRYGAQSHEKTVPVPGERDAFELALIRAALETQTPLLGVCRGFQALNVACGGTLVQHLPDTLGHDEHRGEEPGTYATHQVMLAPDSLAARCAGAQRIDVRSHHHAADRLGAGLVASGWSAIDGDLVEAIERPGDGFLLGVLWHPEEDPRSRVIGALVAAAGT